MIYIASEDGYFTLGVEAVFNSVNESVQTIAVDIHKDQLRLINFTHDDTLILVAECTGIISYLLSLARFNGTKVVFVMDNLSDRTMLNVSSWSQGVISKKTPLHVFSRLVDTNFGSFKGFPFLTGRETSVMDALAKGKTPFKISTELNISIKTVCAHKMSALRKLGLNHLNARSVLIYGKIFQEVLSC